MKALNEKFWSRVNKNGQVPNHAPELGNCWEWVAGKFVTGYGGFYLNKKMLYAHRVSWTNHFGEIPEGVFVCHRCDNRACVNPMHLFLGNQKENMDDMIKKKRARHPVGEFNHSKLTTEKVLEIRRRYSNGETNKSWLGIEFGICRTTIGAIVCRRKWKHI